MATLQESAQLSLGPEVVEAAELESSERTIGQLVSDGPAPATSESLSTFVAELVARLQGRAPTEADLRLYDHVDPEAVDDLFEHAMTHEDASWRLELDVGPETLVIGSDGVVRLVR